jgi:hypothetical protein
MNRKDIMAEAFPKGNIHTKQNNKLTLTVLRAWLEGSERESQVQSRKGSNRMNDSHRA